MSSIFVAGKLKPGVVGNKVADASDVEMSSITGVDTADVQTAIADLKTQVDAASSGQGLTTDQQLLLSQFTKINDVTRANIANADVGLTQDGSTPATTGASPFTATVGGEQFIYLVLPAGTDPATTVVRVDDTGGDQVGFFRVSTDFTNNDLPADTYLKSTTIGFQIGYVVNVLAETTTFNHFEPTTGVQVPVARLKGEIDEAILATDFRARVNAIENSAGRINDFEVGFLQIVTGSTTQPNSNLSAVDIRTKSGGVSATLADYTGSGIGWTAVNAQFTIVLPAANRLTDVSSANLLTGITFTDLGEIIDGWRGYDIRYPASPAPGANVDEPADFFGGIPSYTSFGLGSTFKLSSDNTDSNFKVLTENIGDPFVIQSANLDPELLARLDAQPEGIVTDALRDFQEHLTVNHNASAVWTTPGSPTQTSATITRLAAALWDENRSGASPFTGNYFEDVANVTVTLPDANRYFYWTDPLDSRNGLFLGAQSYVTEQITFTGAGMTTGFQKIIGFGFIDQTEDLGGFLHMLRFGSSHPMLSLENGNLSVEVSNNDGPGTTATITSNLQSPDNGNLAEAPITVTSIRTLRYTVPAGSAEPFVTNIKMRLAVNNTVQNASVDQAFTVTDLDADQAQQTFAAKVLTGPNSESLTVDLLVSYTATDRSIRVTLANPVGSFNSAWNVWIEIQYDEQITRNTPTTYTATRFQGTPRIVQRPTQEGDENYVVLLIRAYGEQLSLPDPQLEVVAVFNGYQENVIRTDRRASEFSFNDIRFGPTGVGVQVPIANIQIYDWSAASAFQAPTHAQLFTFYQRRFTWFGLFTHPSRAHSEYDVAGNIVIENTTGSRYSLLDVTGTVSELEAFSDNGGDFVTLTQGVNAEIDVNMGNEDITTGDIFDLNVDEVTLECKSDVNAIIMCSVNFDITATNTSILANDRLDLIVSVYEDVGQTGTFVKSTGPQWFEIVRGNMLDTSSSSVRRHFTAHLARPIALANGTDYRVRLDIQQNTGSNWGGVRVELNNGAQTMGIMAFPSNLVSALP